MNTRGPTRRRELIVCQKAGAVKDGVRMKDHSKKVCLRLDWLAFHGRGRAAKPLICAVLGFVVREDDIVGFGVVVATEWITNRVHKNCPLTVCDPPHQSR